MQHAAGGPPGRPDRRRRRLPGRATSPGLAWELEPERCAQLGSMLATYVVETVGTQEYKLGRADFLDRFAEAYGDDAAAEVGPSTW